MSVTMSDRILRTQGTLIATMKLFKPNVSGSDLKVTTHNPPEYHRLLGQQSPWKNQQTYGNLWILMVANSDELIWIWIPPASEWLRFSQHILFQSSHWEVSSYHISTWPWRCVIHPPVSHSQASRNWRSCSWHPSNLTGSQLVKRCSLAHHLQVILDINTCQRTTYTNTTMKQNKESHGNKKHIHGKPFMPNPLTGSGTGWEQTLT